MSTIKEGSRVVYIKEDHPEKKSLGYYPPIGTYGTVISVDAKDVLVQWDNGTLPGKWWCGLDDVTKIKGDIEKLDLIIDWDALSESEQITLHELLSKAHSAAIKETSE